MVKIDTDKKVTDLRLEEKCCSYWFVLISDDSETRRRYVVQEGEQTSKESRHDSHGFIWEVPPFVWGTGLCFVYGSKAYEDALSEAIKHPPTDPLRAHVKNK
jgi:hypothetical protein